MNAAILFVIILFGLILLCLVIKINYSSLEGFENPNTLLADICQIEKDNGVPPGTYGCYNSGNTGVYVPPLPHKGPIPQEQYPTPPLPQRMPEKYYIPIPQEQYPMPENQYPMPQEQYPMPENQYPTPRPQYPTPRPQYPIPPQIRQKTQEETVMFDILQLLKQTLISLNNGNFKNYFNSQPTGQSYNHSSTSGSTGPTSTLGATGPTSTLGSTGQSYNPSSTKEPYTSKDLYMLKSECIRPINYLDRSVIQGAYKNNQSTSDPYAPYPILPDFTSFGI